MNRESQHLPRHNLDTNSRRIGIALQLKASLNKKSMLHIRNLKEIWEEDFWCDYQ
jgi:hypothetical protein